MQKEKMVICGATGFIGRNLAEYFARENRYDLHLVRFNRPEFYIPDATWHQADLRNPDSVKAILQDADILIQAAATTSGAKDIVTKPYIHVTDNAVMNSYLFREAFEQNVKHVVFFSCTVMYQTSDSALNEKDFDANEILHPRYFGVGNTKLYLEKMCEFFAGISNTKFTAIRHSNIYGPYDKYDFERSHVFGATISKVMTATDKVVVWGEGKEARDLLYVTDLMKFVDRAITLQYSKYKLFNCGAGEKITINELVDKVIKTSGKNLVIEHDLSKPSINTSLYLDCSEALRELDWKPETGIDEGIQKTIHWWKENINPQSLLPKES